MTQLKNLALLVALQVTASTVLIPSIAEAHSYAQQTEPPDAPAPSEKLMKEVKDIVIDVLHVDEAAVTPTADFVKDLGADELDMVDLLIRFEDTFNIQISDEDTVNLTNVTRVATYIEKKLAKPK